MAAGVPRHNTASTPARLARAEEPTRALPPSSGRSTWTSRCRAARSPRPAGPGELSGLSPVTISSLGRLSIPAVRWPASRDKADELDAAQRMSW